MSSTNKKILKQLLHPTYQTIAALLLFVIALIASRPAAVSDIEADIFFAVHNFPEALFPLFYVITQAGSIYMLGGLLVLYALRKRYHIVIRLLMTGTLAYLLAGFGKSLWGRARPGELLDNVMVLDYIQGPGFPSGHVALATALALTIGHYVTKKNYWLPALWIVGVALSRMYLGVHVPLDIVGGFAIGWLSYALFRHVRIYDVSFGAKPRGKAKQKTSPKR